MMGRIKVPLADGTQTSLEGWIFQNLFLSWASPINASLAYAIWFVLLWLFLMWLLYRKDIYRV
jgi:predicted acyltransferase